jgi:hypothetical protein
MRRNGVLHWEEPCRKPSSKTLDIGVATWMASERGQAIATEPSEITFNVGGPTFSAVTR